MATLAIDITDIVERLIDELNKRYNISDVYIFGSHVTGGANKWSDIDLLVVSPDFSEDRFEAQVALLTLASHIDTRLEPHPMAPEDFNLSNPLAYEVQENGVRVPLDKKSERDYQPGDEK